MAHFKYLFLSLVVILLTDSTGIKAKELLLEDITVISPERSQPLKNAYVKIVDGKIIEVSQMKIDGSLNAERINGKGKFLIPGLMDSHVHLSSMPGMITNKEMSTQLNSLQGQFDKQQPRSYLYFGVTQLLDPSQYKNAIVKFNSAPVKPHLFHCGAAPILGGYPTVFADKKESIKVFDYYILQEDNLVNFPKDLKFSEHTPEAVVKKMSDDGAICVKVFIEDGFGLSNDWPLISNSLLQRVKVAAKKHGLIMMAHANAIDMQEIAQQIGVDVIAHGMWNWNQFDSQTGGLPIEIKQLADKIIEQEIVFQPTFGVMDNLKGVIDPTILNDVRYKKVVPPDILNWYQTEPGQWFKREIMADFEGLPLKKVFAQMDKIITQGERVVTYLNSQNYPLVLASDTPPAPTYSAQPGYSTYSEIKHMAKVGVSLRDILEAATINNAKAFGLEQFYGSIQPGKIANLLILTKNPLSNVEAYDSIEQIIVDGTNYQREVFSVKNEHMN